MFAEPKLPRGVNAKTAGIAPGRLFEEKIGRQECLHHLADDFRPVGVEHLAARLVGALVGVGTEEVALGLQQVRGQAGRCGSCRSNRATR